MNKNSISGCTYFFLHWKSEHLVSQNPSTHPNLHIVWICKSVRIIERSLTALKQNINIVTKLLLHKVLFKYILNLLPNILIILFLFLSFFHVCVYLMILVLHWNLTPCSTVCIIEIQIYIVCISPLHSLLHQKARNQRSNLGWLKIWLSWKG